MAFLQIEGNLSNFLICGMILRNPSFVLENNYQVGEMTG